MSNKNFIIYKQLQNEESIKYFMVNQRAWKKMNKEYPKEKYHRYYDYDSLQIRIIKRKDADKSKRRKK